MKILNFGSLNIDHVYKVENFVEEGATISAYQYNQFCGGKGLNQSIAISRAGAKVYHAGAVGKDGGGLIDYLKKCKVDVKCVSVLDQVTGHAVIQVDKCGGNGIIVYGGANQFVMKDQIDNVLNQFSAGDFITIQNEISNVSLVIQKAHRKGMVVFFNPSPISDGIDEVQFDCVDYLFINKTEGTALSGEKDIRQMVPKLLARYPSCAIVLTLGSKGVIYADHSCVYSHGIYDVPIVDTTAAGDTFCGFFIATLSCGGSIQEALELASKASSICISRPGAAPSIPTIEEVMATKLRPIEDGDLRILCDFSRR